LAAISRQITIRSGFEAAGLERKHSLRALWTAGICLPYFSFLALSLVLSGLVFLRCLERRYPVIGVSFVWACLSEVFGEAIPSYWGELQGGKLTSMFKTNMRLSLFLLQGSLGRPFGEHATRWLSKGRSLIIVLMLCTRLFLSYRNGGDR